MRRRSSNRVKRRLTVGLRIGAQQHHGIVLDVSPGGLFVATTSPIQPGAEIVVEFSARDGGTAFEVRARVARRRRVPQNLQSYEAPGIGLQLIDPPPEFAKLLVGGKPEGGVAAAEAEEAPPAPALPSFRLRLRQSGSPRSRTLRVEAADEAAARAQAAADLANGWEIVEIQRAG
jgi:Tfp pilus assembly protein PilZ